MTESEYIEATNLAKIRVAYNAMSDTMEGYGPLTKERRVKLTSELGQLLEECFAAIHTEDES